MAAGAQAAVPGRFFNRPEALMVAALVAGAVILVAAGVIGGRQAQGSIATVTEEAGPGTEGDLGEFEEFEPGSPGVVDNGNAPVTGGGGGGGGKRAGGGTAAVPVAPGKAVQVVKKTGERVSQQGATREGVFKDFFEFGAHAPITFDGAPLPLAEDPIIGVKGYLTHLNKGGGVNGLKARLFLIDDRYTVTGAQQAADKLVKEIKPFFISGTLGIDQIAKVAKAAAAAQYPIPYFAIGGPEAEFKAKKISMYQVGSSYDQYADMVVKFICKYGPGYVDTNMTAPGHQPGKSAADVRLGTSTLNSENILPVEKRLVQKLVDKKCIKTPVDGKARGTIQKPTEQTTYSPQMLDARNAYGGAGANLIIPLQDPISTTRQAIEWDKSQYKPKFTIANFAHDSDTVLALTQGTWGPPPTGNGPMRVLSGGCYYHPNGGQDPYNPSKCAKMGTAHAYWTSLGDVRFDQNAGGNVGGKSSFKYDEKSWEADGSGGASAYQLIYFWHKAMKDIGTDPTREKFVAALNAYKNYDNLLTSPITFQGTPNRMIGATKFVMLESQANLKYKQLSPGLVDQF